MNKVCKVYRKMRKNTNRYEKHLSWCFCIFIAFYSFSCLLKDREFCSTFDIFFLKQKKSLLFLIFCETSNSYVLCKCIVWCVMCGIPNLNFVRSWLFESMGDLKWTIVFCFSRPLMKLMVNGSFSIRRDNSCINWGKFFCSANYAYFLT